MKKIKNFTDWVNEDFAAVGAISGMGDVSGPTSNTEGSGDTFPSLGQPATQVPTKKVAVDEKESKNPSFFTCTHYRLPTDKELKEIDSFDLTAQNILNGMTYNMVGKGMKDDVNVKQIQVAISKLVKMYPDNKEYAGALQLAKELKPRFIRERS